MMRVIRTAAFAAALALVLGLLGIGAASAQTGSHDPRPPAGTVESVRRDLTPAEIALLRLGEMKPQAFVVTASFNDYPIAVGAELNFGALIGTWMVERGPAAEVTYDQLRTLGHRVANWDDGATVYRYYQTGWKYFVLIHEHGFAILMVLQGKTAFVTYCTLWHLYDLARQGRLP